MEEGGVGGGDLPGGAGPVFKGEWENMRTEVQEIDTEKHIKTSREG